MTFQLRDRKYGTVYATLNASDREAAMAALKANGFEPNSQDHRLAEVWDEE